MEDLHRGMQMATSFGRGDSVASVQGYVQIARAFRVARGSDAAASVAASAAVKSGENLRSAIGRFLGETQQMAEQCGFPLVKAGPQVQGVLLDLQSRAGQMHQMQAARDALRKERGWG